MVVGRLLVACGMNVGWTLAGRGLDSGWTCSGRVVLGQPTPSPPPVHVTACWTFNGPYCTVILLCRSKKKQYTISLEEHLGHLVKLSPFSIEKKMAAKMDKKGKLAQKSLPSTQNNHVIALLGFEFKELNLDISRSKIEAVF